VNHKLLLGLVLCSSIAIAQQSVEQQMQHRIAAPDSAGEVKVTKVTPEQRKRAMQLLDAADAQAHAMKDGGSRAFALMQLARAYRETDKKKAVDTLEDALSATRTMEDEPRLQRIRARLQEQILDHLIPLAPDKIDDVLAQVDANGREKVLISLLRYYQLRKENDKALDTINRIAQEYEIPYDAVAGVMSNLMPEEAAEKQQLFTLCLASFRDHDHEGMRMGSSDFGPLVTQFHEQLPPALVRQAIDVLLDEARKRAQKEAESSQPTNISLSSAKGALAFSSYYDYRLFQLLPVLKSIDPQEADKLLKERQDVQTLLAKYPSGMSSISPEMSAPPQGGQQGPRRGSGPGSGTSMMVTSGAPGPGGRGGGAPTGRAPSSGGAGMPGAGQQGPNPLEMQRMAKLIEDSAQHPQDSIASAATISDPDMRVQAYIGIARECWKKNSSAAKMALGKAADAMTDMKPDQQLMGLRELATLYERLDDTDNAKKTIEKGLDAAEKLLKTDTNADDPNKAPKAYWPSTGAYRSMLALAARISPTWAVSMLKTIPDDDIKALNQIAIANALLDVRGGSLEIMQFTKDGGRMMMMNEDRDR
jgi:tetratricopeptide (TPR) repeat protein